MDGNASTGYLSAAQYAWGRINVLVQEIALDACKVNYDYITTEFDTDKNAWEIGFWEDDAAIAAQTISINTTGRVLGVGYAE